MGEYYNKTFKESWKPIVENLAKPTEVFINVWW
jgi:hypothetical protein